MNEKNFFYIAVGIALLTFGLTGCGTTLSPIVRTGVAIVVDCASEAIRPVAIGCIPDVQTGLQADDWTGGVQRAADTCTEGAAGDIAEGALACALRHIMANAFGAAQAGADGEAIQTAQRAQSFIETKGYQYQ